MLWTRLLSSGTGNSTYVFTLILAMFLIGITIGAMLFTLVGLGFAMPIGLIASPRWSSRWSRSAGSSS